MPGLVSVSGKRSPAAMQARPEMPWQKERMGRRPQQSIAIRQKM